MQEFIQKTYANKTNKIIIPHDSFFRTIGKIEQNQQNKLNKCNFIRLFGAGNNNLFRAIIFGILEKILLTKNFNKLLFFIKFAEKISENDATNVSEFHHQFSKFEDQKLQFITNIKNIFWESKNDYLFYFANDQFFNFFMVVIIKIMFINRIKIQKKDDQKNYLNMCILLQNITKKNSADYFLNSNCTVDLNFQKISLITAQGTDKITLIVDGTDQDETYILYEQNQWYLCYDEQQNIQDYDQHVDIKINFGRRDQVSMEIVKNQLLKFQVETKQSLENDQNSIKNQFNTLQQQQKQLNQQIQNTKQEKNKRLEQHKIQTDEEWKNIFQLVDTIQALKKTTQECNLKNNNLKQIEHIIDTTIINLEEEEKNIKKQNDLKIFYENLILQNQSESLNKKKNEIINQINNVIINIYKQKSSSDNLSQLKDIESEWEKQIVEKYLEKIVIVLNNICKIGVERDK